MNLTPKQRAVNKARSEITKDIFRLIAMANDCGWGELIYFLHYLHFTRLALDFGNVPENKKEMLGIYSRRMDDAFKYLTQIVAKNGKKRFVKDSATNMIINGDLVQQMKKHALEINSKFESVSFIGTFKNVEVSGERDQHAKVRFEEMSDEYLGKFFNYALRADKEHADERKPQLVNFFFDLFKQEYEPYADLFLKEFGLSIDEFIDLSEWLIENVNANILSKEKDFPHTHDGKIDIKHYRSIILYGSSLFIYKKKIHEKYGEKANHILRRLTLDVNKYNEHELKFNIIERQPLIDMKEFFVVSPELLVDSYWANSHYSLLEAGNIKEEYKKRYSKVFVDKISRKATKYGYQEFSRDYELYEGKNQIGDIDLIMKNESNQFLLIEAKNHSIPMDVYFHDFEETKKRLKVLQTEWEKKVEKRILHLQKNHTAYGIGKDFKYLIVTKVPEILSHFSECLTLSLKEFDLWLEKNDFVLTFEEFYQHTYKDQDSLTKDQLNSITTDLLRHWTFGKE